MNMHMDINDINVNVSQIADLLGMNRHMVARRLQSVKPVGGNEVNLKLYRLSTALQTLIAPSVLEQGEMSPQDRKAWYQSENERLKFETAVRELIPAHEAKRVFVLMVKTMIMVLETLPDVLERDCALSPAATERVQESVDNLRDTLADAMRHPERYFDSEGLSYESERDTANN